jgi:hypothetical protein
MSIQKLIIIRSLVQTKKLSKSNKCSNSLIYTNKKNLNNVFSRKLWTSSNSNPLPKYRTSEILSAGSSASSKTVPKRTLEKTTSQLRNRDKRSARRRRSRRRLRGRKMKRPRPRGNS